MTNRRQNTASVAKISRDEMAEIAGLTSYFKLSNISLGSVAVFLRAMKTDTTDSSNEVTKANSMLVRIAGLMSGSTILRTAVKWVAPQAPCRVVQV